MSGENSARGSQAYTTLTLWTAYMKHVNEAMKRYKNLDYEHHVYDTSNPIAAQELFSQSIGGFKNFATAHAEAMMLYEAADPDALPAGAEALYEWTETSSQCLMDEIEEKFDVDMEQKWFEAVEDEDRTDMSLDCAYPVESHRLVEGINTDEAEATIRRREWCISDETPAYLEHWQDTDATEVDHNRTGSYLRRIFRGRDTE